jgi:hypothetical protein
VAETISKEGFSMRLVDDVLDAGFLNKVNLFKSKLPTWAQGRKVFGYAETSIPGISRASLTASPFYFSSSTKLKFPMK